MFACPVSTYALNVLTIPVTLGTAHRSDHTGSINMRTWFMGRFIARDTAKTLQSLQARHVDDRRQCARQLLDNIFRVEQKIKQTPGPGSAWNAIYEAEDHHAKGCMQLAMAQGVGTYGDPNYSAAALFQSYLLANSGVLPSKQSRDVTQSVIAFIASTLPQEEIRTMTTKYGVAWDKF
jgi:hypothetical protein